MTPLLRIGLLASLALAACDSNLVGNGVLGEELRTVATFDAVEVSLGAEAVLTANAASQLVTISVDENLLQYILTPVEAGVLKLRLRDTNGIDSIHPLRLVTESKALRAVRATEASNVEVKGAGSHAPGFTFEVVAAGKSVVVLKGGGGDGLVVDLSGGSTLDASAYPVAGANVMLANGSTLRLDSAGDPVGSAADRSSVVITGGGTCQALVLSGASTCVTP